MSATSSTPTTIRVTAVCVSLVAAKWGKRLTSGDLSIGSQKFTLICDEDGTLRQDFLSQVELSPETQISLRYNSPWRTTTTLRINTRDLLRSFTTGQTKDLSVERGGVRVVFNRPPAQAGPGVVSPLSQGDRTLSPTTEAITNECPRFRILVIGKSGVGKSTLINLAFGINKVSSSDLQRGKADIEHGLESPVNERFILHDSVGFEPGDKGNYDTVKQFIQRRQSGPLADRLHAVWFCIRTPQASERLLEVAAEDFFRSKKQTMGSIPLVVVFTKYDSLVDERVMRLANAGDLNPNEQSITELAYKEAGGIVQKGHHEINQFAGESLPHATVSTKTGYEHTLRGLVELTHDQVGASDMPEAHVTPVVIMMAQRIDPQLKIRGSITVGRKRYWRALRASPEFMGHTVLDCLSVIHADIVAVWNFDDPSGHLLDKKFKELVIEMVQKIDLPPTQNLAGILSGALGGGSLLTALSSFSGFITNPMAPIVLPVAAGVGLTAWAYIIYQNAKNVQQKFMAYIVDLIHIMETLFILTSRDHNRLTRRAIKIAYKTYLESDVMGQAHSSIREYRDIKGRDIALETIESLIKPENSGTSDVRDYYTQVGRLDLKKLNLDREEDWLTEERVVP